MTLSRCPKCNDEVRIPAQVSSEATLRCPLCGETFEAATVLMTLPPLLEIVHDPTPPTLSAVSTTEESTGFAGIDVDSASAHDHVGEQVPAFEFDESEAPQRDAPSFMPEEPAPRPTRRRRPRSPLPQMVGVVLGGLASIPLAQLCLWWIFGADPVDMGPSVGRYVPFVVPAKFRELAQVDDDGTSDDSKPSQSGRESARPPQDRGSRTLLSPDDPNPFEASAQPTKGSEGIVAPTPKTGDEQETQSPGDRSGNPPPGKFPSSQSPTAPSDQGGAGVLGVDFEATKPNPLYDNLADPTAALRERRTTTAMDVYDRLQAAMEGYDNWNDDASSSTAARSQQLDEFYQALCDLASTVLYIDAEDAQAIRAADTVHSSFEIPFKKSTLRQFVANRAARQLAEPTNNGTSDGLVFAGTVTDIRREGDLLVTQLRMNDVSRTKVDVYGWRAPPASLKVGSPVTVFGAMLFDPHAVLPLASDSQDVFVVVGAYLFVYADEDK